MSRRRVKRLLREVAWLAVAVVMALLFAGHFVHVAMFDKWQTTTRRNYSIIMHYEPNGTRRVILKRDYHQYVQYTEMPSTRGGQVIECGGPSISTEELPAALNRSLDANDEFDRYARVGWPIRFASCFTHGPSPSTIVDNFDNNWTPTPYTVTRGLATIGPFNIATRPVFPGFLVLAGLFEMTLLIGRAGLRFLRALRQRIRTRRGLCGRCGYDLAGLSGGVCPECGESRS